jgi:riboflavin synthase
LFTGIVEEVGRVVEASGHRLVVGAAVVLANIAVGDSIAVNGACLTVVELTPETFAVDLSDETLARTALGSLKAGGPVNLERALMLTSRIGGHIVQGHVDGVGCIVDISGTTDDRTVSVDAPLEVSRYIIRKGFIAVDGMSLTVTKVVGTTFAVAVIPYTWDHTVLGSRTVGDFVNLEVDIVAKYVERLLPER